MKKLLAIVLTFLLVQGTVYAQNKTVTGKVTDPSGDPVAQASVTVPGSNIGTSTDNAGNYSITVPTSTRTLLITAINFEPFTATIRGNTANAQLSTSDNELEGVVVTGIKTIKRTEYAGSVARMDEKQIENKPVGSFDQLLQGAAPGISALTSSGQPGTAARVVIRGSNSITGGSDPLYIVDGIEVEAAVFQGFNPNDFATIDILKDASAGALYGSRGGAGVIVVTTKKGSAGKLKLNYSAQLGIKSKPDFAFRPMTSSELLQAQNDYGATINRGSTGDYFGSTSIPGWYYASNNPRYATLNASQRAEADRKLDSMGGINTDWMDYMFRNGPFSNHQISLSGGTGKTRIYSSLGMYNEDGVTPRTDMKRISLRNNIDHSTDKFNFSVSSIISYTKRNFQQSTTTNSTGNPFLVVNIAAPYAKVYRPDGEYFVGNSTYYPGIPSANFVGANQLDLTKWDENYNDQIKTVLSLNTNYKITDEITAGVTAGVDFRETQGTNYGSQLAFSRYSSTSITTKAGFHSEALTRWISLNVRPSLNYRNEFAEKHLVDVSVYGELLRRYSKGINFTGYGIDPRTPNTPAAITPGNAANQLYSAVGGGKGQSSLVSGLAIASYTYDDKYSINGSFRRDASSKLPKASRNQDFYSVGAIWTASNEDFLKNSQKVDVLRLRASYGGGGNENNFPQGDFGYLDLYGTGSYSGLNTIVIANYGNPFMKWETTWSLNLGVDATMFNNRLTANLDVYDRSTKDVFIVKQLALSAGGGSTIVNAGELSNKGVEVNLNYAIIKNTKLNWTVFANVGYNKNNVEDLAGEENYESGTALITEGLPLGTHYEVAWAGVDQATGAPLYYTKDGLVTNVYSAENAVQTFGTYEAPWKGGFGTSVSFAGFDLSTTFSWQRGATKVDNLEYFVENPVGFLSGGYNQSASLNFWKNPGDVASTPSPMYGMNFSSKIIHSTDFLRLRDVTLSYNLPKDLLGKTKVVSNARLYVQGTNLFIWTNWRGMDPEAGPANINLSEFPNPRAVTAGLDITF